MDASGLFILCADTLSVVRMVSINASIGCFIEIAGQAWGVFDALYVW